MTEIINNKELTEEGIFDDGDFVVMKRITSDGQSEIVGGGYKVKSFFLQGGMSALTTFNDENQQGGKVSSPFENLAVPAGLFYINQRVPKHDSTDKDKEELSYKNHQMISDDMIDKLFGLVEVDKKRKRQTRKRTNKQDKRKTRRHA
jgi:hypothetical protein